MTEPAAVVPKFPFMRISRVAEMLRARRKSVSSSSVVGKTLNSTGRLIYMATIRTVTEIMMSMTSKKSSRAPGRGVISAMMMLTTAIGTLNSDARLFRRFDSGFTVVAAI